MSRVTLFFLPGTFVSTFFAMPLFHWEEDGQPIVTTRLLIYWAVTLPLTIVAVTFWLRFEAREKDNLTPQTRRQNTDLIELEKLEAEI